MGIPPQPEVVAHLYAKDPIPAETTAFDTNTREFKIIHWHRPGAFEEHLGFSPENYREATKGIKHAKRAKPMTLKPITKPKKKRPLRSEPSADSVAIPEDHLPQLKELLALASLAHQALTYAQAEIDAVVTELRRNGASWELISKATQTSQAEAT